MLALLRSLRPRSRRHARPRAGAHFVPGRGLGSESLEARRLLAADVLAVMPAASYATGLPLPGLAVGAGLAPASASAAAATSAVTVAPVATSVAPASAVSPAVPSPTGPSTTLSPLMNDAETANATASEVARPRPGLSDRISIVLPAPEAVAPIVHLRSPGATEVTPPRPPRRGDPGPGRRRGRPPGLGCRARPPRGRG